MLSYSRRIAALTLTVAAGDGFLDRDLVLPGRVYLCSVGATLHLHRVSSQSQVSYLGTLTPKPAHLIFST
jgi:hypothetical protein